MDTQTKYKPITMIYKRDCRALSAQSLVRGRGGLRDRERRRVRLGIQIIRLGSRAGIALAEVRGLREHGRSRRPRREGVGCCGRRASRRGRCGGLSWSRSRCWRSRGFSSRVEERRSCSEHCWCVLREQASERAGGVGSRLLGGTIGLYLLRGSLLSSRETGKDELQDRPYGMSGECEEVGACSCNRTVNLLFIFKHKWNHVLVV